MSSISSMDHEREIIFFREFPLSEPPVLLILYLPDCLFSEMAKIYPFSPSFRSFEIVKVESRLPYGYDKFSILNKKSFEFFTHFSHFTLHFSLILCCFRMHSYCCIKYSRKFPSEVNSLFWRLDITPDLDSMSNSVFLHIHDNFLDSIFESLPVAMWVGIKNHKNA